MQVTSAAVPPQPTVLPGSRSGQDPFSASDRAQAARSANTLALLTAEDRAFLKAATGETIAEGAVGASAMAMDIAYARENQTLTGQLTRSFVDRALSDAESVLAQTSSAPDHQATDAARAARDAYHRWWVAAQELLPATGVDLDL